MYEKEKIEQTIKEAELAHSTQMDYAFRLIEATNTDSNIVLRALLIINGGACIALLAFIGKLLPTSPNDTENISVIGSLLTESLIWFAWGVAATIVAMVFSYATSYCAAHSAVECRRDYNFPYVHKTDKSNKWEKRSRMLHYLWAGTTGIAVVFFILGILGVSEIVSTLL